ncbi:MAG: hypothetical protein ACKVOE_05370 [Rickettsiales bacterium]
MVELSLRLQVYAAAISIMEAAEARFANTKASLVELRETFEVEGFTINAIYGRLNGEDVAGFIAYNDEDEVLGSGGYFDELLDEAGENDRGDDDDDAFKDAYHIERVVYTGVDADGNPVTLSTVYGANATGNPTVAYKRELGQADGTVVVLTVTLTLDASGNGQIVGFNAERETLGSPMPKVEDGNGGAVDDDVDAAVATETGTGNGDGGQVDNGNGDNAAAEVDAVEADAAAA